MTNHYRSGRGVEYRNRDHLEADGYVVLRTAGSKGFVDLIGMKLGQLLLVQCKGTGKLTGADWNRLLERAAWVGAVPILATRDVKAGCQELHRWPQPGKCGTVLYRLSGPYVPRMVFDMQPCEEFVTDELKPSSEYLKENP